MIHDVTARTARPKYEVLHVALATPLPLHPRKAVSVRPDLRDLLLTRGGVSLVAQSWLAYVAVLAIALDMR